MGVDSVAHGALGNQRGPLIDPFTAPDDVFVFCGCGMHGTGRLQTPSMVQDGARRRV